MLSIMPTKNYNTNFKAAPAMPDIQKLENALAAIVEGEKILPKNLSKLITIDGNDKSFLSKLKLLLKKIKNYLGQYQKQRLDSLFKQGQMSVVNRKFDAQERLRVLEYEHGAYKKFVYSSDLVELPHINMGIFTKYSVGNKPIDTTLGFDPNIQLVSEERFPSGETKYWECQIVTRDGLDVDYYESIRRNLSKHVLPNGATYTYHYYPSGELREKNLPDGSKIIYFKNGYLKEKYNPQGKLIESNLAKQKECETKGK